MKKKLNIMHIILSKKYSGSEKYVCDLVKYQNKIYNISIITSNKNFYFNKLLTKKVKKIEISDYFKKFQINKIIKNLKPDIIHSHLGDATRLLNKSNKYKIISTLHMNYKHRYYKNCDAIIVSNKTQFSQISKIFKGKIFKNYLWINLKKISQNKNTIKKRLNIPLKNKVFGSIGRFHPQKGFDIILNCFKRANLKNTTLLLIGNDHNEYAHKIKGYKNIILLGHVANVSNYYNIFDIAIFASRWETFGFSLVESMKFKLPIISSIHIGNKDWIKKFNIFVINLKNEKDIERKIISLSKKKLNKNKYNLKMFDYEKNCKKISNIYNEILKD